MSDLNHLRWLRVLQPSIIPKYLIEQIKHRDFDVEKFYKFQEGICLYANGTPNPANLLYALLDPENVVKGMAWMTINELTDELFVCNYSVDRDYWFQGKAVEKLTHHVKDILNKLQLKRAIWANRYPKHSERNGFKRCRDVLMMYEPEEE